jgi:hypothetical protein
MIKISFQKKNPDASSDDVIRIVKSGAYDEFLVSVEYFNGSTSFDTFNTENLYEYIDNLFNIFVMDTPGDDNSANLMAQLDIPGFPSFLVNKLSMEVYRDNINRAIEFWAEA